MISKSEAHGAMVFFWRFEPTTSHSLTGFPMFLILGTSWGRPKQIGLARDPALITGWDIAIDICRAIEMGFSRSWGRGYLNQRLSQTVRELVLMPVYGSALPKAMSCNSMTLNIDMHAASSLLQVYKYGNGCLAALSVVNATLLSQLKIGCIREKPSCRYTQTQTHTIL
jgi:hypothetical protein